MKELYTKYLFNKNIIVGSNEKQEDAFYTLFAIANKFNIKVVKGAEYITKDAIKLVSDCIGEYVPEAFYKGFPQSVLKLTDEERLFDQLLHYFDTYVCGNFEGDAAHSLFEEQFNRIAFKENVEIKEFEVIPEALAYNKLNEYVIDLLKSTRPLSISQYELVKTFILDFANTNGYIKNFPNSFEVASKNTAAKLLADTRAIGAFADSLNLSDIIKVVEEINFNNYGNKNIKKLNLKNQDRKFIAKLLDYKFAQYPIAGLTWVEMQCAEKKKIWNGLLYHIHYKPKCEVAKDFVIFMSSNNARSHLGVFERYINEDQINKAISYLKKHKGGATILRNLNYIISRCKTEEDIKAVVSNLDSDNPIVIIQLLLQYATYKTNEARNFKFVKYNAMKVHKETYDEQLRRKSIISESVRDLLCEKLKEQLAKLYQNKLGKVYISEDMYHYALPIQEAASNAGYGVMTKGSRIHFDAINKKVRAFTYWEKVNDIDLSVIGLTSDLKQREFSWRNMACQQSDAITFSGDQTRGYNGASEFFDIDIEKFKKTHSDIKYLIFCDNVFSGSPFDKCTCTAGYMLRDINDSGEVFEPKTVKSSFKVEGSGTFNYLFALDLEKSDFIWLNINKDSRNKIAGTTDMSFLLDYFNMSDVISVGSLFKMLAIKVVDNPEEAEVIIDNNLNYQLNEDQRQIHSYDTELIMKYMNNRE